MRDPELHYTQSGATVCSFSVACDRDYKAKATNEKATDFIDISAWRNTAEFVSKYMFKGRMAVVDGRLLLPAAPPLAPRLAVTAAMGSWRATAICRSD